MSKYCIYCGDWFQCRDHVIPISYSSNQRHYKKNQTVPCCNECNTLLGSKAFFSIQSRAEYLIERYTKKKKRFLKLQYWSESDKKLLGYNLKDYVETGELLKKFYLAKLDNLHLVKDGYETNNFTYDLSTLERLEYKKVARSKQLTKTCSVCETLFITTNSERLCCSEDCAIESRLAKSVEARKEKLKNVPFKICHICSKEYKSTVVASKYCCVQCRTKSRNKKRL